MGLQVPTVDKFLCCCELKTGVLLVGALTLFGALCGCLGTALGLGGAAVGTAAASGAFGDLNFTIDDSGLSGLTQEQRDAFASLGGGDTTTAVLAFTTAMMAILLIICIGYVVVASLLIHGARKEKPGLFMPWIILTVISLIFDVIQIIGNMVNADHAAWVGGLFFFAIGCYIFIVVWSHRKQLQENMGGGATGKA